MADHKILHTKSNLNMTKLPFKLKAWSYLNEETNVILYLFNSILIRSALDFQSSFVNHGFFVYLVAAFLNKIKKLFQIHRPRVKNVIAVFGHLKADNS